MTPDTSPLTPRKQPRQSRAQATCAAILEATAHILETDGVHNITTNKVAERAGVSIGSLYQYFPNKDAILVALIRDMRRDMLNDLRLAETETEGFDLIATTPILVTAALAHHKRHPLRAQRLEEIETNFDLDADTRDLKAGISDLVVRVLQKRGVKNAPLAAFDLSAIVRGMARAAVLAGERDFDDLSKRITRAALGYLIPQK